MNLLAPYRVLDLTDERGQLAGQILGDLGADVVRIEPPGGSAARQSVPLLEDGPVGERSLAFAAYDRNKRSVVLDFAREQDRERMLGLVAGADIVLDSGPPALLDAAGLDFARLRAANPRIVQVRVTPFGVDGPAALWPASDLTLAALGGPMSVQGDPDRAPIRVSVPQAWRHAGADAAVAALVAHARMRTTGEAVFADVSAQASMTWTMLNAMTAFPTQGFDFQRDGASLAIGPTAFHLVHACKDGYVVAFCQGRMVVALRDWLLASGIVDEAWFAREDWRSYDVRIFRGGSFSISFDELIATLRRFFLTRTRAELFRPGLEKGVTIAPVMTLDDMLGFEQLAARDYYVGSELPTGRKVRAPGAFARPSRTRFALRRRAPRLGEHTQEILAELATRPRACATATPRPTTTTTTTTTTTASSSTGAAGSDGERRALPFEGLKVADFSWVGVGPISGKYLADHGANVFRIESQSRADNLRTAGPYRDNKPGWNRSQFYGEFNTSKRSLALDLKHSRAREIVDRVVRWADVILESFTPGAAARLGFGYEEASRANPSVILVSTCLMGQTGPLASLAGYGYHAAGIAGFYDLTGWPDRAPVGPWNAYTDTIAPRFLTATLLAALDHRRRTGEGQHIDVGQLEAALHFLAPELLARQTTGEKFERAGNRSRFAAPQGAYPCAGDDEWCAIAVESDAQWRALRQALGDPEWARASDLDSVAGRLAAHDAIDAALADWTRPRKPREVMAVLLEAGVPAGHVQRSRDLQDDPQYRHRRFHRFFEHPEMGRVPYSGHAFRISGYDNGPRFAAPLLGGDSFEILAEELGFEPEQIADLMTSGALG
jgi:crotonobetainyl-CoA:carnitine CoA-transferase CaiB-like acyl-CoA transferase